MAFVGIGFAGVALAFGLTWPWRERYRLVERLAPAWAWASG
jgi:hypothetical protein